MKLFRKINIPKPYTSRQKPTTVSFYILTHIAWRNLVSKKLRTFLTVFGIVIGIGAIFFLFSFGLGLRDIVTKQVIGDRSIKSIDVTSPNSRILVLDDANITRMSNLPHVERAGRSFSFAGSVSYNRSVTDSVVYGVDKTYQDLSSLNLTTGRLLKDQDTNQIVVNRSLLRTIGINDDKSALGKDIILSIPLQLSVPKAKQITGTFTVVGVIESGTGGELFVQSAIISGAGVNSYTQAKIVANNTDNVPTLRKQIESLGYQTASPIDTLDQINQIFKFFTLVLVGFGAIGMIVSVLGMFNTLTISLLERTKEIGLMMALGARNRDMRKLFLFEASLLSVVGATIGILLAVSLGTVVNLIMNAFARGRGVSQGFDLFATPWWLIGGTILFMLIVGMIVAYFPARRASRINPIDALRHE